MRNHGFWTYFDFATFLVLCTLVSGGIWALDAWFFAPKRRKLASDILTQDKPGREKGWPKIVEYARSFFPVFFAVLVLRSFIVEPFKIPTGSMIPTLLVGDFILVNKSSYGVRLPISHTKLFDIGHPKRGQVVVFRYPRDPRINFIKRMIGLPGDTIEYRGKVLYINGEKMTLESISQTSSQNSGSRMTDIYKENLIEVNHAVQFMATRPSRPFKEVVPEGHYFVMGDNRDDSADSREWGFVPEENLVGRAFFIWFNLDFGAPWGEKLKWRRIGGDIE